MIGLKRGTVKLCDHEKEWEIEAQNTIGRLKRILGDAAKDIQHVGSTSILSIKAKPIIDIAVSVDNFEDVLKFTDELRKDGFYYRPNASLRNQLLFASGSYYDGTGDLQTHFIHVVLKDSIDRINYINFRDYLNSTPATAKEYEDLKVSLAEKNPVDKGREKYLQGKHDFIVRTLKEALMSKIKIIKFSPEYRDDLIFMILKAKNALGRVPGLNEDLLDIKKNYFDKGDMFWIAVDDNNRVIGSVGYSSVEGTDEVVLHRLFVKHSLKHQGIGTALLKTAENHLKAIGKKAVTVHLGDKEHFYESWQFYPKHGYAEYSPNYMRKEFKTAELWDIYDINRNKTGRTVERGKPMAQDEYHLVVNVWIKGSDGKWLISKRSPNKHYGNIWECCGGSAVSGEDSLTAALREAKEELGIELKSEQGKLFTSSIRQYRTFPDFLDVWVFNQDVDINDVALQEGETCDVKWATDEEILEMERNGEFIPLKVFPYLEDLFESET